jgi:hypothetical protein
MNSLNPAVFHCVPGNRVIRLANVTCVYCGQPIDPETRTKEHVIGRNFVPRGTMDAAWNLHANCCTGCNNAKSDLEDDLSAILLQPDAFGELARHDPRLAAAADRKGRRSFDRDTGKLIKDSKPSLSVKFSSLPGLDIGMSFTAPPQLNPHRAKALAWHHVTAFCYLTTFNKTTLKGQFCQGSFEVLDGTLRSDWGNALQLEFARVTADWPPCLLSRTADGYFQVAIRRHSERCRSWALEWNRNFRIVGFMGDPMFIEKLVGDLNGPQYRDLPQQAPGEQLRYRQERPLADAEDVLFRWPENLDEGQEDGAGVVRPLGPAGSIA